jgi:hypothetical protein
MTEHQAMIFDYAFNSQYYERRIEHLLESAWENHGAQGFTSRNYIFEVSYE